MPLAPKRACRCGGRIDPETNTCDKCGPRKRPPHKLTTKQRGYGYDWQKLVEQRKRDPEHVLCVACDLIGIVRPAQERHHIEKVRDAPDQRLNPDNILDLCEPCHDTLEKATRSFLLRQLGSHAAVDQWERTHGKATPRNVSEWLREQVKAKASSEEVVKSL